MIYNISLANRNSTNLASWFLASTFKLLTVQICSKDDMVESLLKEKTIRTAKEKDLTAYNNVLKYQTLKIEFLIE